MQNFQELPQDIILTDSLQPHLRRRFPDGQYCIGHDSGIYWKRTEPPLAGVKAPDWFLVLGVPPDLDGGPRRSYVLWQELVAPLILLEFVSGDGSEERDRTPHSGKFWVYEQVVRAPYYGIYEVDPGRIEMYRLVEGLYQPMASNDQGRYPLPRLGVELGLWDGEYFGLTLPWMRWWDEHGDLLLMGQEQAEEERRRAERLEARMRELGLDPECL